MDMLVHLEKKEIAVFPVYLDYLARQAEMDILVKREIEEILAHQARVDPLARLDCPVIQELEVLVQKEMREIKVWLGLQALLDLLLSLWVQKAQSSGLKDYLGIRERRENQESQDREDILDKEAYLDSRDYQE